MEKCTHPVVAIQVHPKTLNMLIALQGGVAPVIDENTTTFFMMYCVGSDHEDAETISKAVYDRTYEQMPEGVLVMQVNTID